MSQKLPLKIVVGPDEEFGYAADPKDLPGRRILGLGASPDEAIGALIMAMGIVKGTDEDHPQMYEYTSTEKWPLFEVEVKDK